MKPDRFTIKINGIVLFLLAAALVVASVFFTFMFADKVFYSKAIITDGNSVVFDGEETEKEKITKYNEIIDFIKENYYYDVDENVLIEGSINGMILALNDRYSEYYEAGTYEQKTEPVEQPETVFTKELTGKIRYIRISSFESGTAEEFKQVMSTLLSGGIKGIILDLRDNEGGSVSQAASVADILLPEGTIALAKDKVGNAVKMITSDSYSIDIPLVVLVNGKTAGAAEIITAAFMDYGRATVIGTKTSGQALEQKLITYDFDHSALKLTVCEYFSPMGNEINGKGLEPDTVVVMEGDFTQLRETEDSQLQAALSCLRMQ